jgi:hypothetical protein
MDTREMLGMPFEEARALREMVEEVSTLLFRAFNLVGALEILMDSVEEIRRDPAYFWAGLEVTQPVLMEILDKSRDKIREIEKKL